MNDGGDFILDSDDEPELAYVALSHQIQILPASLQSTHIAVHT